MSSLVMTHYTEQDIVVVTPHGDINSTTAPQFGTYLTDAITGTETAQVVLDMSKVYYMSSAGLRDIISGLKTAQRLGGDLHIAGVRGRLKPVFEMVGLDSLSNFYENIDEAVSGF
ncbi:MAG: anti-sigma factor antagonist [Phototrophicaceae bacterium]